MDLRISGLAAAPIVSAVRARLDKGALRDWLEQTVEASVLMAAVDVVLLERKYNLFSGGFVTSSHLETLPGAVAFFVACVAVNCWITAPGSAAGFLAAARMRLPERSTRFLAFCCAVVPLAVADFVAYQIWLYLGDAFDFNLVFSLTGRRVSELLAVAAPLLSSPLLFVAVALASITALTWTLSRLSPRSAVHQTLSSRHVLYGCSAALLVSLSAVAMAAVADEAFVWGLRKLPAAQPLLTSLERISDVDGDGYGIFGTPRDSAPLNASIHPYAMEIPGNGVDEDGVGGDLASDFPAYEEPARPAGVWPEQPPVVLFVLESFRADVVGAQYNGLAVTPVLDRLARQGLKVDSAWSQNGFTSQSRYHILTGSLADARGGSSLIDDFKDRGYDVAYFSAQDDTFGTAHVDYSRVDTYYDARTDIDNRYTQYTTPGSLAVPASILEARVLDFLNARRKSAPLFLYVNFHDTHYPYVHQRIDNLLNVDLLVPRLIAPSRREQLWATYLNTAANVDRGIGRVMQAVRTQTQRNPSVIVVSDHGESLFDEGFLGHGYALNESQTRIPLIVSGLPVKVKVPFGQVDLRDAVGEALEGKNGPLSTLPAIDAAGNGRVFQYLGGFEQPGQISWLTGKGRVIYDFRSDEVSIDGHWAKPSALSGEQERLFLDLIHTWESMKLARTREQHGRLSP